MMTSARQKLTAIRDYLKFARTDRKITLSGPRWRSRSTTILRFHLFTGISFIGLLFLSCSETRSDEFPNVLLITLDTVRPDFLGTYGSNAGASPEIDAFAVKSVVFDRAIAASSRTVPSHASIMTSLWVREHSVGWVNGSSRLNGEKSLAEVFRAGGYDTAAFVGNMLLGTPVGLDSGFDLYDDDLHDTEANRSNFMERHADESTERAMRWLAEEHERPWFLWMHYQDAHGPYAPPEEHAAAVHLEIADETPLPLLDKNRGKNGVPAYQVRPGSQTPSAYAERYAGEIHFLDAWLGKLLRAVVEEDRNTIVLLTADHGESFGEEGLWFSHGFRTTPDQVHIPFILQAPGLKPGRRRGLVHHVDVAPTLIGLAGLEVPRGSRGIQLAKWLQSGRDLPIRSVFSDIGTEVSAYRGDHFIRVSLRQSNSESMYFSWTSTRNWFISARSEKQLSSDFEDYLEIQTDFVTVDKQSRLEHELRMRQLQALGYLEVGKEAEP